MHNAKSRQGGFCKTFFVFNKLKYMISMWNFFLEMSKLFLLPIEIKIPILLAFCGYYDVQCNKNYKSI